MNTGRAVMLAAVLADPSDDLARLAFADACEEDGDWQIAFHVRKMVREAGTCYGVPSSSDSFVIGGGNEPAALLAAYLWADRCVWRRGFVEEVHCTIDAWRLNGPMMLAWQPVTRVVAVGNDPSIDWGWMNVNKRIYPGTTRYMLSSDVWTNLIGSKYHGTAWKKYRSRGRP